MVEAMILITESAYKELLHCKNKYFEMLKKGPIPETNEKESQKQIKQKESDCHCQDQFGEGLDSESCDCKTSPTYIEEPRVLVPYKAKTETYQSSSEFFSSLMSQAWFKRSPRKYRKVAETIFFSPGVMIGHDNVLHYEGEKIVDSNIFDIIRYEANGRKTFYPGKIVMDRLFKKSPNLQINEKKQKRNEIKQKRETMNYPWYEVL